MQVKERLEGISKVEGRKIREGRETKRRKVLMWKKLRGGIN